MKTFKCVASQRLAKKPTVKVKEKRIYKSYHFKLMAKNFEDALKQAEKIAKKVMVFESLKISEA